MSEIPTRFLFLTAAIVLTSTFVVLVVFPLVILPWLRAFMHDAPVPVGDIIGMRLRGNPPVLLIDAYIALKRAHISATIRDVENAYIDSRTRISTYADLVEIVKKSVDAG